MLSPREAMSEYNQNHISGVSPSQYRPEFSVITTVFNEERNLDEFCSRLMTVMEGTGRSYEVIFVEDGSKDDSLERLLGLFDRYHLMRLIIFDGNFGQWAGMVAGVECARGEHTIFLDCDLEIQPEDIVPLLDAFDKGVDIVSGVRASRTGIQLWRRVLSVFGNLIIRRFLGIHCRDMGCGLKIIRGEVLRTRQWNPYRDFNPLPLFRKARSFADVSVRFEPRRHGQSGWGVHRLVRCYWRTFFSCFTHCHGVWNRLGICVFILGAICLFTGVSSVVISLGVLAMGILGQAFAHVLRHLDDPRKTPLYEIRQVLRR